MNFSKTPPSPINETTKTYKREITLFNKMGYNNYEKLIGYRKNISQSILFKKQKHYKIRMRIRIGEYILEKNKNV